MSKTYGRHGEKGRQDIKAVERKVIGQSDRISGKSASKVPLLACLLVVVCAAVLAAHWPVLSAGATSFDDGEYLTDNRLVQNPCWMSAKRFLTEVLEPSTVRGYYQPLTMISLMVDYALGGRVSNLLPFHRTSLMLHVVNTALVIVLVYLLFGSAWVAAGVGLLFGLHPMTVEAVAWVSDRKTVLSAFFSLWCLILYVNFTHRNDWRFCIGCLVMYVLALMSKPTSLPLPVLMVLMDYWPLRRLKLRAVLEKLPLFVVAAVFAVITYVSQSRTFSVELPVKFFSTRTVLVLCHNIIFYLYKIVWPANLSSNYTYPQPLGLSEPMVLIGVVGSCILISLLVISLRWTPVALTGWLIFFVAIFPALGVIGFSDVIASDKFAYLPSVGLLMVVASLLSRLCGTSGIGKVSARRGAVVMVVLILAGAESVATQRYLVHWRDTITLYKHMLTVTPDAARVYNNLGNALRSQGKLEEAIGNYRRALQFNPEAGVKAITYHNLANSFESQGKLEEAISHYRYALQVNPRFAPAYHNLGDLLQSQGRLDEAIFCYRQALQIRPDHVKVHNNLAIALYQQGKIDEAVAAAEKALQLAQSSQQKELAEEIQDRLRLYKAGRPYIEKSSTPNKAMP